jgi:hypothetical protein
MKPWNAGRAVAGPKPPSVIDPLPSDRQRRHITSSSVANTTDLMIYKGLAMVWLVVEKPPNRSALGVDRNAVRGPW